MQRLTTCETDLGQEIVRGLALVQCRNKADIR